VNLLLPDPLIAGAWASASFVLGLVGLTALLVGQIGLKGAIGFMVGWQLLTLESLVVGGSSLLAIGPTAGWLTVAALGWNRAR
jgi:hypothetical protein